MEFEPYTIDTTKIGDYYHTYASISGNDNSYVFPYSSPITTISGGWTPNSYTWTPDQSKWLLSKLGKEEEYKVSIEKSNKSGTYSVSCKDEGDLSLEHILQALSAIKGHLMLDVAPIRIKEIECYMTPEVKNRIVQAGRKLKMYGKKPPIVARYDDYGFPLPDKIEIGDTSGINIKIVDPEKYGNLYFELRAIELPLAEFIRPALLEDTDLPF